MKKKLTVVFLLLIIAGALPGIDFGQIAGGSVTGTAKDEGGGVLPGVTVTLQGSDATRTIVADESGQFRFYNVPPGTYKLTLSLPSFTDTS